MDMALLKSAAYIAAITLLIEVSLVYIGIRGTLINTIQRISEDSLLRFMRRVQEAIVTYRMQTVMADEEGRLLREGMAEAMTVIDLCLLRFRTCPKYLGSLVASIDFQSGNTGDVPLEEAMLTKALYERNLGLVPPAPSPESAPSVEKAATEAAEMCLQRLHAAPTSVQPLYPFGLESLLGSKLSSWSSEAVHGVSHFESSRFDLFLLTVTVLAVIFLGTAWVRSTAAVESPTTAAPSVVRLPEMYGGAPLSLLGRTALHLGLIAPLLWMQYLAFRKLLVPFYFSKFIQYFSILRRITNWRSFMQDLLNSVDPRPTPKTYLTEPTLLIMNEMTCITLRLERLEPCDPDGEAAAAIGPGKVFRRPAKLKEVYNIYAHLEDGVEKLLRTVSVEEPILYEVKLSNPLTRDDLLHLLNYDDVRATRTFLLVPTIVTLLAIGLCLMGLMMGWFEGKDLLAMVLFGIFLVPLGMWVVSSMISRAISEKTILAVYSKSTVTLLQYLHVKCKEAVLLHPQFDGLQAKLLEMNNRIPIDNRHIELFGNASMFSLRSSPTQLELLAEPVKSMRRQDWGVTLFGVLTILGICACLFRFLSVDGALTGLASYVLVILPILVHYLVHLHLVRNETRAVRALEHPCSPLYDAEVPEDPVHGTVVTDYLNGNPVPVAAPAPTCVRRAAPTAVPLPLCRKE